MNITFDQQVGIITGAASGLGLAISLKLSQMGVKLALLDRDKEGLENLKNQLKTECEIFHIEIAEEEQVKKLIGKVAERFGRIDILINCAGIAGETNKKTHETNTETLRHVFEVNFMGCYFTSKYALPWMLKNNYGRILHIASIAGKEGNPRMLAYSASKAALVGMAKVQGKEYAHTGITINALAPAVIRTAFLDKVPEEQVKYMTDKIPMKRCCTLEEATNAVSYIVSPECSFTTGFTFDLSGGRATY